jgi:hypothetical protein
MADSLWMRLREVRWEQFKSSPASKKTVQKILENLASRKEPRAMKASHDLWLALCSGEVYSAAEPCFPFLIEILGISGAAVQGEILEIFLKFAQVSNDEDAPEWEQHLRMRLHKEHRFFTKLSHSRDEIVADRAQRLLEVI